MKVSEKVKNLSFAEITLYVSLIAVGVFHVYLSCLLSLVLIFWLCLKLFKKRVLSFKAEMSFVAVTVMTLCYALSALWAIDSGEAIFGFFKFLPLPLYCIVLMQEENGKERIKANLPFVMAGMTLLSTIFMYIPGLSSYFAVSGRLSGFVQYPNTFAILLLVSELLLITKEKTEIKDYICISVLLFGILYTGSRAVFVLAFLSNAVVVFASKNKKLRIVFLALIGGGILLALLFCLITDSFGILSRYLSISVFESTFVGRLLYAADVMPTVATHPFGIGYMGYYFIQRSLQTGVYSVMFLHNDLLQIALDVGWIPALLIIAAAVTTFANKKVSFGNKIILATFLAHICFDFDLMYVAVFMTFLLFLEPTPRRAKKTYEFKTKAAAISLAVVLGAGSIYFGLVQGLTRFERHYLALSLYPANTTSETELIVDAATPYEAAELGENILKRNEYVSLAYSAIGRYAYSAGDFAKVITYKTKAIQVAPFATDEYNEYAAMLINGIKLYTQAGDVSSAEFCKKELFALEELLNSQQNRVSALGSMIDPQPDFEFSADIQKQIDALRGEN